MLRLTEFILPPPHPSVKESDPRRADSYDQLSLSPSPSRSTLSIRSPAKSIEIWSSASALLNASLLMRRRVAACPRLWSDRHGHRIFLSNGLLVCSFEQSFVYHVRFCCLLSTGSWAGLVTKQARPLSLNDEAPQKLHHKVINAARTR